MALAGSEAMNVVHTTARMRDTTKKIRSDRKVLMLTFTFPPCASAGTFRALRFVRYLTEFGWKPIVVSGKTEHFPNMPIDNGLNDWVPAATVVKRGMVFRPVEATRRAVRRLWPQRQSHFESANASDSSKTTAVDGPPAAGLVKSLANRLLKVFATPDEQVGWLLPAVAASWRLVRQHRPQALYSSGPPHSSHLAAVLVKVLTRLPLVLDFRDPWAHRDWHFGTSALHDRIHRALEKLCVRSADRVILNTEALCQQFRTNYPAAWHDKFVTITNGYDPEVRKRIEALVADSGRDALSSPVKFRLCHAGAL